MSILANAIIAHNYAFIEQMESVQWVWGNEWGKCERDKHRGSPGGKQRLPGGPFKWNFAD